VEKAQQAGSSISLWHLRGTVRTQHGVTARNTKRVSAERAERCRNAASWRATSAMTAAGAIGAAALHLTISRILSGAQATREMFST
jgi:hypothetical protein